VGAEVVFRAETIHRVDAHAGARRIAAPPRRRGHCDMRDGYAAVDAMVALLMLSLAVIFSLRAMQQGEKAADLAHELQAANVLTEALMQDGPRRFGAATGWSRGFAWTLETQATGAERPIELCRRFLVLRSEASSRRYWAASTETCPLAEAS
jgi:hypothetical protein